MFTIYVSLLLIILKQSFIARLVQRLYSLGARKIFIDGVGPLGCIPSQLYNQKSPDGACIEFINGYVRGFNQATIALLKQLTASLPGSIYVYANAYDLVSRYIDRPADYGTETQFIMLLSSFFSSLQLVDVDLLQNECVWFLEVILFCFLQDSRLWTRGAVG